VYVTREKMIGVASIGRLALLLATALAVFGCNGPPLQVAQNVDLSQFQGKWYEIARLPRSTETGCFGTTAFYTQNSDGTLSLVNQCNVGASTGPLNTVSMIASVQDPSVPAKLALQVGGFAGNYWILEVGATYNSAVVGAPSRSTCGSSVARRRWTRRRCRASSTARRPTCSTRRSFSTHRSRPPGSATK